MTVAYVSVRDLPDKLLEELFPDKRDKIDHHTALGCCDESVDRIKVVEDIVSKAIKTAPVILVDYQGDYFEVHLDDLDDREVVREIVLTTLNHVKW